MITKNSVVKIQNLVVNHESWPAKSNPTYNYEDTLYFIPHFLKLCLTPPPPPPPPPSLLFLVSLTEWMIVPHLMYYFLLTDIMDLHIALVPWYNKNVPVCFMQQVVWLLRSHIQRGFLLMLLFDITHINEDTKYI